MANTQLVSEEAVKKMLNIDSFRNLSKEKIIEFVSLIPQMDKDVAISVINQFPTFANSAKVMIENLKETTDRTIESNDLSQKAAIDAYRFILDQLGTLLLNDDITAEERAYITEKMIDVANQIADKDTENKSFLSNQNKVIGVAVVCVLALMVTSLGVNIRGTRLPSLAGA